MAKLNPKHPFQTVSDADLAGALTQIGTEIADHPLRSSVLARIMRECFAAATPQLPGIGAWPTI